MPKLETLGIWAQVRAVAEALLRRNLLTWRQVQAIMGSMIVETSLAGYVMVFEKSRTGYSAHVPDLPGCVAAGHTLEQTQKLGKTGSGSRGRAHWLNCGGRGW